MRAVFERIVGIDARGSEAGYQTRRHASYKSKCKTGGQHRQIEGYFVGPRQPARRQAREQRIHAPMSEQHTTAATEHGKQQAFSEQQSDKLPTRGTERSADGQLLATGHGTDD